MLTLDQIDVFGVHDGVRVESTGLGDMLAIGTHDLDRATAALDWYLRETIGQGLRDYLRLCPDGCTENHHGDGHDELRPGLEWAVFHDSGDGWRYDLVAPDTPGAIPMVVILG